MSEQLTIVCPHCDYSRVVLKSAVPASASQATCPRCKQAFHLNSETMQLQTALPPPVTMTASAPPVIPPVPVRPAPKNLTRKLRFTFSGSSSDYFGIWIVNTLLKMLTMGFYSAWAKVRKRRFFYGSTSLLGQPFEYLAEPLALFKGWLIAAVAFILYAIGSKVSPVLSMSIGLIIFLAFPWLLIRSRMFNAINSSYRNIRFGFRPDYRQAYEVFAGLAFLSIVSLGLLFPYMLYRQKKFMVENSTYGTTPFAFVATVKDFYILAAKVGLGFIAILALLGVIAGLAGGSLTSLTTANGGREALSGLALIPIMLLPLVYFLLVVYGQTAMANLSWNSTAMRDSRFRSTLRTRDMALLFVTNALAIMFSLGLLMPWATIRLTRYRFDHLELFAMDSLDDVVAAAGSGYGVGATGEEIGDLFDMPIEIAL